MAKTRRERRAEAVRQLRGIEYASSLGDPANDNGRTPVEVACGKRLISYKDECHALINLMSEDECEDVSGNDWEFRCSACGARIDVTDQNGEPTMWDANGDATWPSHCPNCGAHVKSKGASEITHLPDAEQENRRSHEGDETTSVSFDPPKVTLVDGDSDLQSQSPVSLRPESETMGLETDSREKLEADVSRYFSLWMGSTQRTQEAIRGWLDRQAAITASECSDDWQRYKRGADEEVARLTKERDELQEELDNSVELPKDADGEYIRVGDTLMVYGEKRKCCELKLGSFGWRVHTPKSAHDPQTGGELHHYHAPTAADVLTDFAREYDDIGGAPDEGELWEKLLSKYAEKFRMPWE